MAGEANPGTVGDSSADEAFSPIMSFDEFNMLQTANTNFMSNLNMDPNAFSYDSQSDDILGSQDPFLPQMSQQSYQSDYPAQDQIATSGASHRSTSDTQTYTQLNEFQASQSDYFQPNVFLDGDGTQIDGNQLYRNFKGRYDFDIIQQKQDLHITKSAPWTYSTLLNKLYVSFNMPCPIQFHMSSETPFGTVIRAMPYFMEPRNANYPVIRCFNHMRPDEPSNQGFAHIEHVIRCNSPGASYQVSADGRLSVVVPYVKNENPMAFPTFFSYFFTCFTSCVGGMNRRPIVVVFSLEHGNQILGQTILEVRVCACPGRDRRKNERQYNKKMENNNLLTDPTAGDDPTEDKNNGEQPDSQPMPPPEKKSNPSDHEDKLITVGVQFQARERFAKIFQDILNGIKDYATQATFQIPNFNFQLFKEEP